CTKRYVEEIERGDMVRFATYLRDEREQSPRSTHNKFENVMTFLKGQGVRGLVAKNDRPRYVEAEVEIYEREDIDRLLAACNPKEKLWWQFFQMTGEREQEVIFTSWRDVNLKDGIVSVRQKPAYQWTPKAYKERSIPIPQVLTAALAAARPQNPSNSLVF